jgi:Tol biopolymer transport system component
MKKIILIILLLLSAKSVFAQFDEFHSEYDWYTIKGKHCFVHFHTGAERTASITAKICDDVWDSITSLYGYEPDPVNFIIKDIDDYANGATYYFDNKIEIWASSLETDLRGTHNWLRNVISHEFTHMVQLQSAMKITRSIPALYLQFLNYEDKRRPDILYGYPNIVTSYPLVTINVPSWLAEGTAQYQRKELGYEDWDTHRDMVLRSYALSNKLLSMNEMGVFNKNSLGNESVYNSGFALVRYISAKYGEGKIREITHKLSKLNNFTFNAAVKEVLGITDDQLYNEWSSFLKKNYAERSAAVLSNRIEGAIIEPEGIGNFHPLFSPDGKKIYYTSTKGYDYFSLSSIYVMDIAQKTTKLLADKVTSTISQIPNTDKIIYAKLSTENKGFRNIHDIFSYDPAAEKEERITKGLRANNPSVSHDGKSIVFIFQEDGSTNLGIVDINGSNFRKITLFKNGEQVFNPVFSIDDKKIIFDLSYSTNRDIMIISTDGSGMEKLIGSEADERNPFIANDGTIIYSSDETGIFNIYSFNPATKEKKQLTNVIGGAYMPAMDNNGNLCYSGYTSEGFKLFYLNKSELNQVDVSKKYVWIDNPPLGTDKPFGDLKKEQIEKLKNYDDFKIPDYPKEKYSGFFSRLSIYPTIRIDNYKLTNKFLDRIKPGVVLASNDVLNRYSLMASANFNRNLERDLSLTVGYRDKIPGLSQLGLRPELGVEIYSISRQTTFDIPFGIDSSYVPVRYDYSVNTDLTYNLFEADFIVRNKLFSEYNKLELRFILSEYTSELGSFIIPESGNTLYPTRKDKYFIGKNIQAKFSHDGIVPTVDSDINPFGRKVEFQYNYEFNRFNNDAKYEVVDGILKPLYNNFNFHRVELNWKEYIRVAKDQTFNLTLRAGAILGNTVPDFFDYYLGGIIGMKSFPFYSISGNRVLWLNAGYRFPLWKNIDAQLGHIYIDNIYFSVYGDIGNAWNGKMPAVSGFKKGVGAEIRIKMNSFYIFPTSLFFNTAYSFDKYERLIRGETVSYGKRLEFYGGILFDFSF